MQVAYLGQFGFGYVIGKEVVVRLKASIDYGMRAILYLAVKNTTCSSKDIAEDMSVPRDYLIQLAQLLRKAGIILAHPGKHGGYQLAKPAADISVLEVIKALEEGTKTESCKKAVQNDKGEGYKQDVANELLQELNQAYRLVGESMCAYLGSLNVESLLAYSKEEEDRRKLIAQCLRDESYRLNASD